MNPPVGLILGSGWGGITGELTDKKETSFEKIFKRTTTVPGHSGKIITGKLFQKNLLILSGRFHTYEGYSAAEVSETVKYLHKTGVKKIIITSASGALNPNYRVGDLVILHDLITLFCQSPLVGSKFQNLSQPFSPELSRLAVKSAIKIKIRYQRGIYAYMRGPHFETFADKKALRVLGADVVGMSTVPEAIMANYLNLQVLGLSLVTNLAFVKHDHKQVLAAVKKREQNLKDFFVNLVKMI